MEFDLDKNNHINIAEGLAICTPQDAKHIATKLLLNGDFLEQLKAMKKLYYQEVAKQALEKAQDMEGGEHNDEL